MTDQAASHPDTVEMDDLAEGTYDDEWPEDHTSIECGGCENHWQMMDFCKWIAEGLTTLDEVIDAAQGFVDLLRQRRANGFTLLQPVDNGYICYNQFDDQVNEDGTLKTIVSA